MMSGLLLEMFLSVSLVDAIIRVTFFHFHYYYYSCVTWVNLLCNRGPNELPLQHSSSVCNSLWCVLGQLCV
jgi:hypothetical protein